MLCYIGAAVLFFTDHPKLSLLPLYFGVILLIFSYTRISEQIGHTTVWPVIQIILSVLAIVMAFVSKKANPKYIKVKVQ